MRLNETKRVHGLQIFLPGKLLEYLGYTLPLKQQTFNLLVIKNQWHTHITEAVVSL